MIRVLQLKIRQLENSFNSHLEKKHFKLVLPSQPNSLNQLMIELWKPVTQEIVGKSQGELSSSDRTGELVKEEEKRVLKSHDRTEQPVEGRLHKVQEDGYLKNRDDVDKFNLEMDDENIDFNISGVPNAMVKRSQSISVQNLIQKIESHPQREALQNDLQQHVRLIPSAKSQKMRLWLLGILNYAR